MLNCVRLSVAAMRVAVCWVYHVRHETGTMKNFRGFALPAT